MRCGVFHRIKDAAVVPDFDTCVGPPVETVARVAAVIERGSLFQIGATWAQREFDAPLHAIDAVNVSHPDRGASVALMGHGKVDRRNRHPIVRNRKIEFNTEGCPHAAVSDAGKFDAGVGIKHRSASQLVDTCIKMTPEIGKNAAFQIFIFQIERSPLSRYASVHQIVT